MIRKHIVSQSLADTSKRATKAKLDRLAVAVVIIGVSVVGIVGGSTASASSKSLNVVPHAILRSPQQQSGGVVTVGPPVTFVDDTTPIATTTVTPTTLPPTAAPTSTLTVGVTVSPSTSVPAVVATSIVVVQAVTTTSALTNDPNATTSVATPSTSPTIPVVTLPSTTLPVTTLPVTAVPVTAVPVTAVPVTAVPSLPVSSTKLPAKAATTTTTVAAAASTPAQLKALIDAVTKNVPGLSVAVSVDGIGMITERDADVARIPASTQKLYVGGASLLALGANATMQTEVRASAITSSSGVLTGDLVLRGGGDPTITSASLGEIAADVAKTGLKTVTGDLVVDESHFDSLRRNEGWKLKFVPGEVGPLSSFLVDGNHRVGAQVEEPALANIDAFRSALKLRGVAITGTIRKGTLPLGGPVLAKRVSPPLQSIVAHMLKESDNTYAETLLKELGARSGDGSTLGGIAAVRTQFEKLGVVMPLMADGSGLSSINRSTARQQMQWLGKLRTSPIASSLIVSLPTSCIDGTLKRRLCGTSAAKKVNAKTGTLDYITSLSGYTVTASGRAVTFSFLANLSGKSTTAARAAIDRSLVAITSSKL
jgi:serine-type D-Ala-D-Ala carboxypeptidase/endopeptidase (penicillin-binding protein 4)